MDCKTVEYCVTAFFEDNIDVQLRYEVVCHLLKCAECYHKYEEYAKNEKLHFDIVREVSRVEMMRKNEIPMGGAIYITKRKDYQNIELKAPAIHRKDSKDDSPDRWMNAHKHHDYSELMNVKAIRDIYNTENKTKDYGDNKKDFVDFLTKKVCQKIDFLEKCFKIEEAPKDA